MADQYQASGQNIRADHFIDSSDKDATASNDNGRVAQLQNEDGNDAKIAQDFTLPYTYRNYPTRIPLTGASTPQAVWLNSNTEIVLSNASNATDAKFVGFVNEDVEANYEYGTKTTATSDSFTHTLEAEDNRLLIVGLGTDGTKPSSATFNGNSMTKLIDANDGTIGISIWYRFEGSSNSDTTATVSITGGTVYQAEAFNLKNVDQNNGIQATNTIADVNDGGSVSITPNKEGSVLYYFGAGTDISPPPTWGMGDDTNLSPLDTSDESYARAHRISNSTTSDTGTISSGSGFYGSIGAAEIYGAQVTGVSTAVDGVYEQFSGLSNSEKYYVQNADGQIGTSTGTNTVQVGKAISDSGMNITY